MTDTCDLIISRGLPVVAWQCLEDRQLAPATKVVMLFLCRELDLVTYRPMKIEVVAKLANIRHQTASRELKRLHHRGYLEIQWSTPRLYKLPWSRIRVERAA